MRIERPSGEGPQLPQEQGYTAKSGDTLDSLSKQFNVSLDSLAKANNLSSDAKINPGMQLVIPGTEPPSAGIVGVEDQLKRAQTTPFDPSAIRSWVNTPREPLQQIQQQVSDIRLKLQDLIAKLKTPFEGAGEVHIKEGPIWVNSPGMPVDRGEQVRTPFESAGEIHIKEGPIWANAAREPFENVRQEFSNLRLHVNDLLGKFSNPFESGGEIHIKEGPIWVNSPGMPVDRGDLAAIPSTPFEGSGEIHIKEGPIWVNSPGMPVDKEQVSTPFESAGEIHIKEGPIWVNSPGMPVDFENVMQDLLKLRFEIDEIGSKFRF